MANGKTHCQFGRVTGIAATLGLNYYEGRPITFGEVAGSVFGTELGYRLPDMLEPATSPRHRSFFHSQVFAVGAATLAGPAALQQRERLLAWAEEFDAQARMAEGLEALWLYVKAFCCRLLAGFLVGAIVGYGSHLLLDALTPMGLPVLA
ncbi:MAG TPA: metal-dependent hydrolase [Blastocatellia bacterium]|nr:metal-dependent hydrolase [Blastocatellia bacterium]